MSDTAKTILIVEDEKSLSHALQIKLEKEGYTILVEHDGADGLHTAINKRPDLILLDINMPVLNGIAMLQKLREDTWGRDVKVIMLTNFTDEKMVEDSISEGAFDYLVKSDWPLEKILEKIKEKLS